MASHIAPSRTVQIGRFKIVTTSNHPLRKYLARFPLYDQFVPNLCKFIEGTVVDIGANIGDTMAAILSSNPSLKVICAEPDETFFDILESNRNAIDARGMVKTFKVFISNQPESYTIVKNEQNSTGQVKLIETESATAKTLSFSDLLAAAGCARPALIKSDTDGFDASILASIADHIERDSVCRPILFFEMQTYLQDVGFRDQGRAERQEEFFAVMKRLSTLGYHYFLVLDNFGTPLLRHSDQELIRDIEFYISNSQVLNNVPTIHFTDVVLFQETQAAAIDGALNQLLSNRPMQSTI